nr:hypothetical protein [Tanacetum cinerariifolium]
MLKGFDKEDLDALWRLVKEKFSTTVPTVDKEKALWVELKRLSEPDIDDVMWKLQRYMHYAITWKLYSNCGVHQVSSTTRRHDIFMLTEKNYPLSNGVITQMLSAKLQVEEDSDMARYLVMKIFMEAKKPKSRSKIDTAAVASGAQTCARSCVIQGTFLTQGKASSIPIVFSRGGSISPEGFLPSVLLFAVIIVVVAIVVTVVLVVVDAIIRVIAIVGGVSSIIKLLFVIIGDLVGLFYSNRLSVCIPPGQGVIGVSLGPVFLLVFLVFSMVAACVFRATATISATNFLMAASVMAGAVDAKPIEKHLNAVKRVFRYLKGTINMGLWYSNDTGMSLTAYADADHTGCQDTRRSTSGSAQFIGDKLGSATTKVKLLYVTTMFNIQEPSTSMYAAIFIKEHVENGIVELYFVRTEYQLAGILTKPLPRERFNFLIKKLGIRSMSLETLKRLAEETDE